MVGEQDGGIDRREAIAIGAAARHVAAQARQQGANVGMGAGRGAADGRHPGREGNRFLTGVFVVVVMVGTLATMIALGR